MFDLFFQTYVTSVFILMLHMFHTYVGSIFIWMLHMFCNGFSSVFQMFFASVSDACFNCFICLQTYVTNVSSRCFKTRSGGALLQWCRRLTDGDATGLGVDLDGGASI
jgi:hypothetical protein